MCPGFVNTVRVLPAIDRTGIARMLVRMRLLPAGRNWALRHGYFVLAGTGSSAVRWGSWREIPEPAPCGH
jgi:hypothetical protein